MDEMMGDRIYLRRFEEKDLFDFNEYAKDPAIGPNAGWLPHKDIDESKQILSHFITSKEVWAIIFKENEKVIGSIGLHQDRCRTGINARSLGYILAATYHHQGLMRESVKIMMHYAFEVLKVELLSVYHFPFNLESKKVIEHAGFHYEGTLRMQFITPNKIIHDSCCYSLLRSEYEVEKV